MTCTEEYQEHIEYTFHAFCKVVIRNAMYTALRTRSRKNKREISLDYLTEEKHYPLGTEDEYFIVPEPDEQYMLILCGDTVLFDVGCRKDGYCADMTRTFFYKKVPSEKHRAIYETVRRANAAAEAILKPGVPLCEVDKAARQIIEDAGYGPNFTHRLGHFIGLEVHEYGDVSSANTKVAEVGNIFSIEPGIYVEGEVGGRIWC